ncbi:hypothetical protein I551_8747 [Mycobacterium ulcerans str. Harvey]|uniref:Uncharacterized protein n=1 Tax=Mycobacterium ulcerans str. Harvey TaxID=1299332 RepID=A0ABN0R9X0_MYCUL|nr:hypothetical protein I551_8747 [Mycobacterium ulcerans str. Harvey]
MLPTRAARPIVPDTEFDTDAEVNPTPPGLISGTSGASVPVIAFGL